MNTPQRLRTHETVQAFYPECKFAQGQGRWGVRGMFVGQSEEKSSRIDRRLAGSCTATQSLLDSSK